MQVCPGIPDGKYKITNLAEADCSKNGDAVECQTLLSHLLITGEFSSPVNYLRTAYVRVEPYSRQPRRLTFHVPKESHRPLVSRCRLQCRKHTLGSRGLNCFAVLVKLPDGSTPATRVRAGKGGGEMQLWFHSS
eukprot:1186763-Prorocentrum_minimum.AAC.5